MGCCGLTHGTLIPARGEGGGGQQGGFSGERGVCERSVEGSTTPLRCRLSEVVAGSDTGCGD